MLLADRPATNMVAAGSLETLRLFAFPPRLRGGRTLPLPFPASDEIGLVLVHDPAQRFGVLPRGVEEPVPPSEGRRIRDFAALSGFLHRLAFRQGFPNESQHPFLCSPCNGVPVTALNVRPHDLQR